jgi:hypothetical protein
MRCAKRSAGNTWPTIAVALVLLATPFGMASAADAREGVAQVVRLLGYGGAIHNFKNYVLRGQHREDYRLVASQQFTEVTEVIDQVMGDANLTDADRNALKDIRGVAVNYLDGLQRIKVFYEKGWRVEDIDRVVLVEDAPAFNAIKQLRGKWQWDSFEELEYQLGYGAAIHHFKNYVLRASDIYHTYALQHILAAESLLGAMLADGSLSAQQRGDLATIERVTHAYLEYLPLVERFIRMQRPIHQVDLAVKVNDSPALAAFKRLRAARIK